MKYPIGIQTFEKIIEGGYTYVDKTDMVYSLAHDGTIYFLSRPRRFGKSLLVSTLKNYFLGKKELFKGLKIDALEKDWKTYPVFHIDFNGQNFMDSTALKQTIETFLASEELKYGKNPLVATMGERFKSILQKAHEQTGLRCVVLIDEYDKPLLDVMGLPDFIIENGIKKTLEEYNREILKNFYSTFKLADAHLQFVFLTGVTKFSQITVFSGFNQPNDISMDEKYETLCGISKDELTCQFAEPIAEMAEKNGCTVEEMQTMLKRHYDGYHFSKAMQDMFNPFSVLNALQKKDIQDYWFRTGTPTYLVRLLADSGENLNEITGKYYDDADFYDYRADEEHPLPMIYQSGYLTIKDFDPLTRCFLLDFPNEEVKKGFVAMVASNYLKTKEEPRNWVTQTVRALAKGDTERCRVLFTSFLASIPYTVRRHENETEKERYFSYTLYLLMRITSCYLTYIEKEQSYGRLDCSIETDDFVYIFEFKLDGSAADALKQIEDKGYATEYLASGKKIYKIGVSISSETGTVEDWRVLISSQTEPL